MRVILNDRSEYIITEAQGKRLQKALVDGTSQWVTIRGEMIRKTAINRVAPGGYSEADVIKTDPNQKRLKSDNRDDETKFKSARKASAIARKNLRKRGLNV